MGIFRTLFPILHDIFTMGGPDPVEQIQINNIELAEELKRKDVISIKLNATKEQIEEIKRLKGKRFPKSRKPKPYSPLGEYLINNFGDELVNKLIKHHEKI